MTTRTFIAVPAMLTVGGLALAGLVSGVAQAQITPAPANIPCSGDVLDADFCGFGGGRGGGGGNPFGTGPGQVDLLPGVTKNGPVDLTPGGATDLTPGAPALVDPGAVVPPGPEVVPPGPVVVPPIPNYVPGNNFCVLDFCFPV